MDCREGELLGDIECGGTTSEEEGSNNSKRGKKATNMTIGALSYDSNNGGGAISSNDSHIYMDSGDNVSPKARVELLIERNPGGGGEEYRSNLVALLDKRNNNSSDQRKINTTIIKPTLKKASKPPRPPKGPTLSPADLKLVKELSELAARKRERIERIKALKKMKESKRPSSTSNLIALLVSILFFLVIILQGVLSRNNSNREYPVSPAPAIVGEGLISIHLFNYAPANEMTAPISPSHSSLEQGSSSSVQGKKEDYIGHKYLVRSITKLNLTLSLFGR